MTALVLNFQAWVLTLTLKTMKRITLLSMIVLGLGAFSCKKDRTCECTTTYTSPSGNVTTDPSDNTTYKEIRKRDAKNLCQKSTVVNVNSSGGTSTTVSDCKLK
jgi:hypothetical protein